MWNFFGQVGSGLLGTIGSIINTKQINDTNTRNVQATNAANREMVEMQNKAAAAESQKAYDRSKASNQVGLMTAAGMSRAGAINALNGGGSYTPAPVNVAQDAAPQDQTTDLSAITNIAQAFAQRSQQKHDQRMQSNQLDEQKRQFNEQLNFNKEQLQFEKDKWNIEKDKLLHETNAIKLQNEINEALKNYKDKDGKSSNLLIEGAVAERLANMAEAQLNAVKASLFNSLWQVPDNLLSAALSALRKEMKDWDANVKKVGSAKLTKEQVEGIANGYDRIETDGNIWTLNKETGEYTYEYKKHY